MMYICYMLLVLLYSSCVIPRTIGVSDICSFHGYHKMGQSCYWLTDYKEDAITGTEKCIDAGGIPAEVINITYINIIEDLFMNYYSNISDDDIYIGIIDANGAGEFRSWLGNILDEHNWGKGQPGKGTSGYPSCVVIKLSQNNKWYTVSCETENRMLCSCDINGDSKQACSTFSDTLTEFSVDVKSTSEKYLTSFHYGYLTVYKTKLMANFGNPVVSLPVTDFSNPNPVVSLPATIFGNRNSTIFLTAKNSGILNPTISLPETSFDNSKQAISKPVINFDTPSSTILIPATTTYSFLLQKQNASTDVLSQANFKTKTSTVTVTQMTHHTTTITKYHSTMVFTTIHDKTKCSPIQGNTGFVTASSIVATPASPPLDKIIESLTKRIEIDKRQTSQFKRKFYSASDPRASSAVIGAVAGGTVAICSVLLAALDFSSSIVRLKAIFDILRNGSKH